MMGWEAFKIILKDHLGSLAIPSTLLGEGREALSPIRWFMFFLKRIKISKKNKNQVLERRGPRRSRTCFFVLFKDWKNGPLKSA